MKILIWIVREARSSAVRNHLIQQICTHNSSVVIIAETRISRVNARNMCSSLSFFKSIIVDAQGFKEDLGKYPSFPIGDSRISENTHKFVVEKIEKKLSGWKANMLPVEGKRAMIQQVVASIPLFYGHCAPIPEGRGLLRNCIQGPLRTGEEEMKVKYVFDKKCGWNQEKISFCLPEKLSNAIESVPRQTKSEFKDYHQIERFSFRRIFINIYYPPALRLRL
ncbi:hypothetical protein ACH5RR_021689 [Cinchona calisaya]|uniref:Uncharacterized protein n=1 Tax=Cinchona calisaya TaxID=153742 RepID=A0ABD2ZL84_9GENT